MPTPGPLELVIILVIALLILGPGKLPDVGAVARQEHQGVPQGVVGRPGSRQGQRRHVAAPAAPPRRRSRSGRRPRHPPPPRHAAPAADPAPGRPVGSDRDRLRPLDERRRFADHRQASRAPSTRPWPTPTPCASRVSADVPRRPTRSRSRRRPPRPATSRSCRSSTTSASCARGCSGRSSRSPSARSSGSLSSDQIRQGPRRRHPG